MISKLTPRQLKRMEQLFRIGAFNITRDAKKIGISRNTLKKHYFAFLQVTVPPAQDKGINEGIQTLHQILSQLYCSNRSVKSIWLTYRQLVPKGYQYSQFAFHYARWILAENKTPSAFRLKITPEQHQILVKWRQSNNRSLWEKAVLLLEFNLGVSIGDIAKKVERSPEKLREWLKLFSTTGLACFECKPRKTKEHMLERIAEKKNNLIRLLHEPPQLHGFNRTSWRLKDLATAYLQQYQKSISIAMISVYIRQEGYVFRKARKVLTSPDPDFRTKLTHIQTILQNLGPRDKFFSIDEYGPFSVKMKGGRSLVKRGEIKTFPQHQPSKGFLICTAALELSTNQITHFYSKKKDTEEMIKLVELLCSRYPDQDKLYLSWDAAIWHASKKLKAYLEQINADNYRAAHNTPIVELAPLPASAQFLNVIESVFSGLAKSVIHHSDYPSVGHCQAAIDRYFRERNVHFALHPKKAGNKIWGKERTVAEFRDSHNCKDPAWR